MLRLFGWKFALIVAVPLMLATAGVGVLSFDLLDMVSNGANLADRKRTEQVVQSAFKAEAAQLQSVTFDNANWDDAVRNSYGNANATWLEENYGVTTSGEIYNAAFVADRSAPTPLFGYRRGSAFLPDLRSYFRGGLASLVASMPNDLSTPASRSALLLTEDGLAVVAVAAILPVSTDLKLEAPSPRFLVLVKYLTPDILGALSEKYVVEGLSLSQLDGKASASTNLWSPEGSAIATVRWVDQRPGDAARQSVVPKTMLALGFMSLVMTGIGGLCWLLLRNIAKREEQARFKAMHDPLTGLPNRLALTQEITRIAEVGKEDIAVAFADLDGFKEVNDSYDHETGDKLIRAVAEGLRVLAAGGACVARLGGDEFVALYGGSQCLDQAKTFAANLIAMLGTPFEIDGRYGSVGASVGIASAMGGKVSPAEIMRRADVAMYRAKAAGKNRYWVFSPELDAERNANVEIAEELRQIAKAGTIALAYQPIVEARGKRIAAVEVLARWPAQSRLRPSPERFIAIAETSGLIDDLGEAILDKACREARRWEGMRLCVNISPVQLRNPSFVERTLATVARHGLAPGRVELEVTEGVLVDDLPRTSAQLEALRRSGIAIALDDFGAGYSSVGYLQKLTFDRVKIDRSVAKKVYPGSGQMGVAQATVILAASMAPHVLAEGIENAEQGELMRLAGCGELQGFHFHKPMGAEEIGKLLAVERGEAEVAAA